jgi:hypothetical protein
MNAQRIIVSSPMFPPLARGMLAEGKLIRFAAHGSSMTPFIYDGDVLTVEPASAEALRGGDIVFYESAPPRMFTHRLLRRIRTPEGLRLAVCGDNQVESATITPDQVLGRVITVYGQHGAYNPASWMNRKAALASARCRRAWRKLQGRFCRKPHHA